MKSVTIIVILKIICLFSVCNLYAQNSKYPQKLENDICSNLVIGNFICKGCAQSDRDVAEDIREDAIEALKKFKYCLILNRDKLTDIIEEGDNEASISTLNEDQRTKIRQIYQAERIMFGKLKPQSNGSILVTIEINNLNSTDRESYERFVIPQNKYENYETRYSFVEKGMVEMLLGTEELSKNPVNKKDNSLEPTSSLSNNFDIAGAWYYESKGLVIFEQQGNQVIGIADGMNTGDPWRANRGGKYIGELKKDGSIKFQIFWGNGSYSEDRLKVTSDESRMTGTWNWYANASQVQKRGSGFYEIHKREIENQTTKNNFGYVDVSGIWYSKGVGMIKIYQEGNKLEGTLEGIQPNNDFTVLKGGKLKGEIGKDQTIKWIIYWGIGTYNEDEMKISSNGKFLYGKWNAYQTSNKIKKLGMGYYIMSRNP